MPTTTTTAQITDFTRDVIGRYVCNGLDEAAQRGSVESDC